LRRRPGRRRDHGWLHPQQPQRWVFHSPEPPCPLVFCGVHVRLLIAGREVDLAAECRSFAWLTGRHALFACLSLRRSSNGSCESCATAVASPCLGFSLVGVPLRLPGSLWSPSPHARHVSSRRTVHRLPWVAG